MKINNFIALYGTTNVGKTTQIEMLKEHCKKDGLRLWTQKYPVYDLVPTGPLIVEAIKHGNPKNLSAGEIQALMAKNRFDFQLELESLSATHHLVVAEMYTGTGIAYGIGDGVHKEVLLAINNGLIVPGTSILLDGKRFFESVEKGHRFEEDDAKTESIRRIHLDMAKEYGWFVVNADQTREAVHNEIWTHVSKILTYL